MSGTWRCGASVHLERPARGGRHERGPVVVGRDHPLAGRPLGGEHVGEQVAPAGARPRAAGRGQHRPGPRRDERVRVDLPVRVVQRHADLHAPVLEAEDLLDAGQRGQLGGAVGQRVEHGPHPRRRQRGERRVVVGGEADDLAAAERRAGPATSVGDRPSVGSDPVAERREPVLEHHHVVVGGRDLGEPVRVDGHSGHSSVGRQEGPGLPVRGDRDPLVEQRVVPQLRTRAAAAAARARSGRRRGPASSRSSK